MLAADDYKCQQAASPKEALDILNSGEESHLLLCNLSESLETGLIERVTERFPDIPVVMTGAQPISLFLRALRMGAYDYLAVPFERELLLVVVRRAIEYRRLKLENRAYQAKVARLARKSSTSSRAGAHR